MLQTFMRQGNVTIFIYMLKNKININNLYYKAEEWKKY